MYKALLILLALFSVPAYAQKKEDITSCAVVQVKTIRLYQAIAVSSHESLQQSVIAECFDTPLYIMGDKGKGKQVTKKDGPGEPMSQFGILIAQNTVRGVTCSLQRAVGYPDFYVISSLTVKNLYDRKAIEDCFTAGVSENQNSHNVKV